MDFFRPLKGLEKLLSAVLTWLQAPGHSLRRLEEWR